MRPTVSRGLSRRSFLGGTPLVLGATSAIASGVLPLGAIPPAEAAVAATASSGGSATAPGAGISTPAGWGQYAAPRLAAARAGTGRASVALVGDSICRGFFASDLDAKGWGGLIAGSLRASYGDGGSGFQSCADTSTWMSGVSGLSSATTIGFYQAAGNLISTTGTWTPVTANHLGPGGVALKTAEPTATVSATVRGTAAKVFWLDGGAEAMGGFTIRVDGNQTQATAVKPTGVYRINVASIAGLSTGTHTVVITATGATSTTQTVIIGVAGENSTGCLVNQFSRYGQTTAMINNSDALVSGTWNGGWNYPADLAIFCLGANDAHSGLAADQWARNVRTWLAGVYDSAFGGASTGAVDGVLLLSHIGNYDNGSWLYQDYVSRAAGLAESFGMMLIDLWTVGRNSWNWWRSQPGGSYWANAGAPGHSGTDGIHLSDLGHQYVSTVILNALTPNLP